MASTGNSYPNTSLASSDGLRSRWLTLVICLGAGLCLVLADRCIRAPLHVPGWRGLIAVALLVAARRWSLAVAACTGSALAAVALTAGIGGTPMPAVLSYLVPALVLDFCFLRRRHRGLFLLMAAGGLANAARLLPVLAGGRVPGVHDGALWYPLTTHFLFGAGGSLIAFAIFTSLRNREH